MSEREGAEWREGGVEWGGWERQEEVQRGGTVASRSLLWQYEDLQFRFFEPFLKNIYIKV